jgi:micrococcal nuclease
MVHLTLGFIVLGILGSVLVEVGSPSDSRSGARERVSDRPRERVPDEAGSRQGSPTRHQENPGDGRPRDAGRIVFVDRVIDGDTIEVALGGVADEVEVRLIGADAPETVPPGKPAECLGPTASAFAIHALGGERVRLEFDVQRIDRFGRVLAYVWTDGKLFNQSLVEHGLATLETDPPHVRYVDRIAAAQRRARQHERGVWGSCRSRNGGGS